jgi:tetratricopeptide (TPR) repeat protein
MDCRKSLVLAFGLLGGAAGCVTPTPPQTAPTPVVVEKTKDPPRHPPKNPETCVALGDFFAAEGSSKPKGSAEQERLYDQARREYQQALEIDAKHAPAYRALGRLYTTLGDHERAVAAYRNGLDKHPEEAPLWFDLGMCHARSKEWDKAVEALGRAAKLDPENRQCQNALGYCLALAGRSDEALNVFRKNGGEAQAHYNLARILHHPMNKDAEARQHLQAAVQAQPTFEPAHRLLAQLDGRAPSDPAVLPAGFEAPAEAAPTPQR